MWTTREFGEILILLAPFVWLIPALLVAAAVLRLLAAAWTALIVLLLLPTGYRGAWLGFALAAAVWIVGRRRWKLVLWGFGAPGADRGHGPVSAGQQYGDACDSSRLR